MFYDDIDELSGEVRNEQSEVDTFKEDVLYKVIDSVCEGINKPYQIIF